MSNQNNAELLTQPIYEHRHTLCTY